MKNSSTMIRDVPAHTVTEISPVLPGESSHATQCQAPLPKARARARREALGDYSLTDLDNYGIIAWKLPVGRSRNQATWSHLTRFGSPSPVQATTIFGVINARPLGDLFNWRRLEAVLAKPYVELRTRETETPRGA